MVFPTDTRRRPTPRSLLGQATATASLGILEFLGGRELGGGGVKTTVQAMYTDQMRQKDMSDC